MSIKARSLALGTLAALVGAFSLQAQCAEGNFGTAIGNGDDTVLGIQSLGFAFPFNGTTYTDVHISTNGFVYLSNAGTPAPGGAGCCAGSSTTLAASTSPMIAAYWSDLNVVAGTGNVKFNALPGKAVITWENTFEYGDTNPCTFQMQLSVSGEVTFTYDSRCQIRTAGDFLVGMSEGGGAAVPAASDFSVTGSSTTNTNYQVFTAIGSFDLAGQSVLFVPTAPGYVWVPSACPSATNTNYGKGCYDLTNSFYQLTTAPATSAATLSNTGITMIPTGGAYTVLSGGTYTPPSGAATVLTLTDDSQVTTPALTTPFPYPGGTASTLTVCSNGSVWVATGNSIAYAPAVATMLSNPQTAWYAWHDYNPGAVGSGSVKFEQVGTTTFITWDGVYSYSGTTAAAANQMQFQFDSASGIVVIAFGTVSSATHTLPAGEPHLVGYSPGGASIDPGSTTFATDLPLTTSSLEQAAMQLSAAPTPVSSAVAGSTVVYTTTGINEFAPGAGIYVGVNVLSIGQLNPGVDLFFIGAPGCKAYVASLDVLQNMVGVTSTNSVSLPLPAGLPSGIGIFSQTIALIAPNSLPNGQNAFGMTVSNGVASTIGSW